MTNQHTGSCFCGKITVQVSGPTVSEGFCHCNDCRNWSGTPVTAYALWPAPQVQITSGADFLKRWSKTGACVRAHCSECGSLMLSEIPAAGLTDVYPLRLTDRPFTPQAHVHYGVRVVDLPDGLPKFADMPDTAGGTGRMIDE